MSDIPSPKSHLDRVIAAYRGHAGEERSPVLHGDILAPEPTRAELEETLLRLIERRQTAETAKAEQIVRPSLIL